jgi:sugar O-acyltransferase (sialic acid O-acetyltransferase NeuD family)
MSLPVILLGGGGHSAVLLSMLMSTGRHAKGYLAPSRSTHPAFSDVEYLGSDNMLAQIVKGSAEFAVGVGSVRAGTLRSELFMMALAGGHRICDLRHPSALVDSSAHFGQGAQIMAGAIVQAYSRFGNNVIINTGAIVEHDCIVGDHSHVASGATICGGVHIGANAHIGAGSVVLQGSIIGAGATIGAAACVTRNVPEGATVTGVPAMPRNSQSIETS